MGHLGWTALVCAPSQRLYHYSFCEWGARYGARILALLADGGAELRRGVIQEEFGISQPGVICACGCCAKPASPWCGPTALPPRGRCDGMRMVASLDLFTIYAWRSIEAALALR